MGSCIRLATISHLILCPKLRFLTGVLINSLSSNSSISSFIFFSLFVLDPNLKLLIVADGVGSQDCSEIASSYVAERLIRWFKFRPQRILNNTLLAQEYLENEIFDINNDLYEKS